ncbi:hypothetical protein PHLCEN_2v1971 [Hermanssonia centrifuga]|uniref:Uncharacterized protein n=1 Tax=Hermanssonia centrifuga TaxID=98765 RepID=A0A2R6RVD9_9APHY|nr:hypothetical protein PHLCEN_2v1971 [Hermanssonia centrifuga]
MSNNHPTRPPNLPPQRANVPSVLDIPLPSPYTFPVQSTAEHENTSGGAMQLGGSPPYIPSVPMTRRGNQYRYDPDAFQSSAETSQRYPPPMGGSFATRRDVGTARFRLYPDHYNAEDVTSAVMAQVEEGRNHFHPSTTSRSEPHQFEAHEHQPQSYYSTSRRSSTSSMGNAIENGSSGHYPLNRDIDCHQLPQRAYTPDILNTTGALQSYHHPSRPSSSLSRPSRSVSNTSQHSQVLGVPQPGTSHTTVTYLHPSQSQHSQSLPGNSLHVGTPGGVAASPAFATVPSFGDPAPGFESRGFASPADDILNAASPHPDGLGVHDVTIGKGVNPLPAVVRSAPQLDGASRSHTMSSTTSHPDANGDADTSIPTASACVDNGSPQPNVHIPSASDLFNDDIPPTILDEPLDEEFLVMALRPQEAGHGDAEPAHAERDATLDVEEKDDVDRTAQALKERIDGIDEDTDDGSDLDDGDDEPIDWKRRVTDENRRKLNAELTAVDELFSDIAKKSGFSMEQVSAVYQSKSVNMLTAPNYWNLYSVWFADHTLQECRRIHPDTPDELINTIGVSANDRSRCFSLFKREYSDNYKEILSAYHDVYILSSAPQTVAKRVRTFRRLCDRFEMMAQSVHKQFGFEVAFVATGSSAHQDDKVGKVFESSGLSGFFKRVSRSNGTDDEILAHAKAHAVYNVSELVLHANYQVQDAELGEDRATDLAAPQAESLPESALATPEEIGHMNDEYLLKYIKLRLNILFQLNYPKESVDLEPAPMNNFPWLTLPMKLADGRVMLCGWPRGCRHPASGGNEGRGNKGMSSLHLHERRILANAFGDAVLPLTIRKIDGSNQSEDVYLKKNKLIVTIEGAPPSPDERALRGIRTLVRKQNHKTASTDHRGPHRLEMIPESTSLLPNANDPEATGSSIPLRKRRRASEVPQDRVIESEDDSNHDEEHYTGRSASPSRTTTRGQKSQPTAKKARIVTPEPSAPSLSPHNGSDDSVVIVGYNPAPVPVKKARKKAKVPAKSAAATTVRRRPEVIVDVPPSTRSVGKKRKLQLESEGENEITDSDIRTTYPKSGPSAQAATKDWTAPVKSAHPAKATRSLRGQTATTPQPSSSKLPGNTNQRAAPCASARGNPTRNDAGPSNRAPSEALEENPSPAPVSEVEMVALFQRFLKKQRGV